LLDDAGRRTYVPLDEAAEIRFEGVGPTMARLFEKVPASRLILLASPQVTSVRADQIG
jgi:hypothetical protein